MMWNNRFYGVAFLLLPAFFWIGNSSVSKSMDEGEAIPNSSCQIDNNAFQVGEEITYKVYYNLNFIWIPAGEVVFKVDETGSQYHLSATGSTYSSYEWFFKVRDQYDTYVDKRTLLPSMSIRDVNEGKYTLYDKVTFNQSKGSAYGVRGRSKENIKERNNFEVDPCMHDILSIVYFSRNIDFDQMDVNDNIPIEIFMDKEEWPLKLTYMGTESNKKVKGGDRYNTYLFSPETIAGSVLNEGDRMKVWVSQDANRLPVLIESPVSVGSVMVVLKDYKGLRHELAGKLK